MTCWLCNAERSDHRLIATTFHFWARLCPACQERYGVKDDKGAFIVMEEKHGQ